MIYKATRENLTYPGYHGYETKDYVDNIYEGVCKASTVPRASWGGMKPSIHCRSQSIPSDLSLKGDKTRSSWGSMEQQPSSVAFTTGPVFNKR